MRIKFPFLAGALALSVSTASAAVTCVANQVTGKFEPADRSATARSECEGRAAADLLASFTEAQRVSETDGTKVIGGVIITNTNNFTAAVNAAAAAKQAKLQTAARVAAAAEAARAAERMTWEILQADGTLQKTLARWGALAGWEVHWSEVPEIKNPGYVRLPDRDFLTAADYVLSRAKTAAKAVGVDLSITAYPNRVLVIKKEAAQ